jgi:hypothetical protein
MSKRRPAKPAADAPAFRLQFDNGRVNILADYADAAPCDAYLVAMVLDPDGKPTRDDIGLGPDGRAIEVPADVIDAARALQRRRMAAHRAEVAAEETTAPDTNR